MSETERLIYSPPVDTHLLRSKHVAQTFQIQVAQPERERGDTSRYAVVYVTDANRVFGLFKGLSHIMQASTRDAPRFILVGIGYPSVAPRAGAVLRTRDFSPPNFPKFTPKAPPVEGVLLAESGTKEINGAEDFRDFIEHELILFIDDTYPTVAGDRTYFGHSGGAQFGLFAFFTRPSLFKNYVVSSPSLVFRGELEGVQYPNCEFMFDEARRFIASCNGLDDIQLYLSAGSEEEFEPGLDRFDITSSLYRMTTLLKTAGIPGLKLMMEVLAGETHMTAWPIAFIHGIQAVLGRRKPQLVFSQPREGDHA